jgi:integrase
MKGVYEKVKGSDDWYICYLDQDRKRHRRHIGIGLREAAEFEYVKTKIAINAGTHSEPERKKNLTLREAFELRLASRELAEQTVRSYRGLFNTPRFDALRDKPIRNIRTSDVAAILKLKSARRDKCSNDTRRNYRTLIFGIFSHAIDEGYATSNPVKKIKKPQGSKGRTRYLEPDEEQAMREELRDFWPEREAELDFLLNTGLRVGECWYMTWDRVHPDRGVIETPDEGKTGYRPIPMNAVSRRALEILYEQSAGSRFVIPNDPGKVDSERTFGMMRYWARSWQKLAKKVGVDGVTAHTFRHTFASRLVMAGVSLSRVQKYLGHSTITMTERYAHLAPENGQADIERLCIAAPAAARPQLVKSA